MTTVPSNHLSIVQKALSKYNFSDFAWVLNMPTVANIFKPDKRCGIYVLRFMNDQYYVGQAIDVVRRYTQHSKVHNDIQEIAFKRYPRKNLNEIEQQLIKILEAKYIRLRNISLTSIPHGDTDLDLIISKKEQNDWLQKKTRNQLNGQLINQPMLQEKYTKKYNKLIKRSDFNISVYPFLREYFAKCVLQPARTELSFWSLTCMTKAFLNTNDLALCRLNMFWCEVLTIWIDNEETINFSFHLTKSGLTKGYLKSLKIKSLMTSDHYYQKGGPDQFQIEIQGIDDALKLLHDSKVVLAIKTFNLRQMQKGATIYGRNHCIDLAKYILS